MTVTPRAKRPPGLNEHQIWYRRLLRNHPDIGTLDPDVALLIIGRRHDIHPSDAYAIVYRTRNAALLHSRANREAWGHGVLHPAVNVEGVGWVSVLDLRANLAELGCPVTDPAAGYEPWPVTFKRREGR